MSFECSGLNIGIGSRQCPISEFVFVISVKQDSWAAGGCAGIAELKAQQSAARAKRLAKLTASDIDHTTSHRKKSLIPDTSL